MFGSLGTNELVLILGIIILLFGVGRISKVGGEMEGAIREFRKGLKGEEEIKISSVEETTHEANTNPYTAMIVNVYRV